MSNLQEVLKLSIQPDICSSSSSEGLTQTIDHEELNKSDSFSLVKEISSIEAHKCEPKSEDQNMFVNDVTSKLQGVSLDNGTAESSQTHGEPKKKNAKKKRKYKKSSIPNNSLDLVEGSASANVATGIPSNETLHKHVTKPKVDSLQEQIMNNSYPLHIMNNETVNNYNQHQINTYMHMRNMLQNQNAASAPITPCVQGPQSSFSAGNSFHMAQYNQHNNVTKYLHNVMHHPLLNRSISIDTPEHARQMYANRKFANSSKFNFNTTNCVKTQKKQMKNNEALQKKQDIMFEPYISEEDVKVGLASSTLIEGVLRINPKQFQNSYVPSIDRSEQDILIDGIKFRNRALEGDVVIVKLLFDNEPLVEENKQKRGKVVYIKEKLHTRKCIGNLKLLPDKNPQKALFVPRDHRIPRLNIPFTSWPDNFYRDVKKYENTLFLAEIVDWPDTRFALGKILSTIGRSGDMVTETKAILAQTDLDVTPFGPEVRHLFPRLDYTIPEEEINKREDCRQLCVFSIDPFNCRDIDDAVSCKVLDNGNYEIGIHIADVSHFLTENTLLDEQVSEKATTIYMVERAYHMLPDELCMLCSLFPGVDKLTFSVFFEMTVDAEVINRRFSKTIINSCSQLAYEHCQAVLEDNEETLNTFPQIYNGMNFSDLYKSIKILGRISSILRRKRFEGGALRIDQPKVSFNLNAANGLPESFWIYESKESHQLIEEFMLLTNMFVACKIYEKFPEIAFLRCHPPPSRFMLQNLANSLKPLGIDLDVSSAGNLHKSLLLYSSPESSDKGKIMVLNMLCAKPMTRAKYFCANGSDDDDFHHYALNVPVYTHFTSPIRRYADIMVHRLLAAYINGEAPKWEVDRVRWVAAQCNKQKYNTKKAGELSTELYMLKYIAMNSPVVTDAVVVDVREKYIDVIIVAMGLNRRIYFNNDFPGEYNCIKNDAGTKLSKMTVTWNIPKDEMPVKQVIEVFSLLKVEMHKGDDMNKVETKLVKPVL